jgi:putative ABC transport system permease protein
VTVARIVMRVVRRVAYLMRFRTRQAELLEELAYHRELLAKGLARQGVPPDTADVAARRAMGNETSMREQAREVWFSFGIDALLKDCRHAWRGLGRSPLFTIVAVLTLALGMGANTAIFSVVHHLLLAPLPFPDGNRIVRIGTELASDPSQPFDIEADILRRVAQRSRTLEDFASDERLPIMLGDTAVHDQVPGVAITPSLLHTLRVRPILGRGFTSEDAHVDAQPVAMISHAIWQARFAGARSVLGQTIRVNGILRTIVGVTPPGLTIPMRFEDLPDVWLPLDPDATSGERDGFARLRRGVSITGARQEVQAIVMEHPDPRWPKTVRASVARAVDRVDERLKRAVQVLFIAVSGLLFIACANVANLLFMRGWTRQRELAIRRALGAGRMRVARHLLIESLTLSVLGGGLGLLIVWKGLGPMLALHPGLENVLEGVPINSGVLRWTIAISIGTGLLFGIGPAFFSTGDSMTDALRTGIRSAVGGVFARRLRSAIVVGEIAVSFTFLAVTAVLVRSFVTLARFDVGYDVRGLRAATIKLKHEPSRTEREAAERALLHSLSSIPGVTQTTFGNTVLMTDVSGGPFAIEGVNGPQAIDLTLCETPFVSPEYFRTMELPILEGRTFTNDREIVVNRRFARRFWPNRRALGARLRVGQAANATWLTVVGIAGDLYLPGATTGDLFTLQIYRPTSVSHTFVKQMSLRVRGNPVGFDSTLARAIEGAGVSASLASIRSLESMLDQRILSRPRFALVLFVVFASIALVLTAVGLYAIIAYAVTQRTHEIGVRVALGAAPVVVARLIVGDGFRHVVLGGAMGIILTFASTRLLTSFLFAQRATDPIAFGGAAIILGLIALMASLVPTFRALRVDPIDALRAD